MQYPYSRGSSCVRTDTWSLCVSGFRRQGNSGNDRIIDPGVLIASLRGERAIFFTAGSPSVVPAFSFVEGGLSVAPVIVRAC